MTISLKDLVRELSVRCDDVVAGIATGGTATTIVDSRLIDTFSDNDVFNGGTVVINSGAGNMVFATDMETVAPGDFASITVTDNDCKVYRDKSEKHSGKYSYKFVTGADASDQSLASYTPATTYTTLYAQESIYCPADYTGAASILRFLSAASATLVSVNLTAGNLSIVNTVATETYTPTSVDVTVNKWHRLELAVVISATVGRVDLWLDDAHIYTGRALNTGATAIGIVTCGLMSTTVAEAKTIYIDDLLVDQAYIGTRTAENEKVITDYAGDTGTVTWSGSLVSPSANVTRYSIYDWPKTWRSLDQKKRAINNAIRTMWPYWYMEKVDPAVDYSTEATLTTVQNQFYYELPADCDSVFSVWIEGASSVVPYWQNVQWSVDSSGGTKYLRLPDASGFTTGLDIRLHYMARPIPLTNDNDDLNVDEAYLGNAQEYIMARALEALWINNTSPAQTEMTMSATFKAKADEYRQRQAMPIRRRQAKVGGMDSSLDFNQRIAVPGVP